MRTRSLPPSKTLLLSSLFGILAFAGPASAQVTEEFKILPGDGGTGQGFGSATAIADGVLAVGADQDDDSGAGSGSAYLYDAGTGAQLAKLVPTDGQPVDEFGFDVAIDGSTLAVGAKRDDDNGRDSGSLYLYDAVSATLITKVLPNDGAADDNFGEAVDLDQGIVAVGAHGDDDLGFLSGSAYLFDVATGLQTAKLVPADGADRDHFGISIAIDLGVVAIGADGDDDNGFNSGSAYLYDAGSGSMIRKLLSSDGDVHDEFGSALAIEDGVVVAGVAADDDQGASSGSAYVFAPFVLSLTGAAGGTMTFRIDGATPSGRVALVYAFGVGGHVVTNPLTGNAIWYTRPLSQPPPPARFGSRPSTA